MNRRQFSTAMAALGLSTAAHAQRTVEPETLSLSPNGWMPNNERLPVLLYHRAFDPHTGDLADILEEAFKRHQWPPRWRNGVYPFHHFHSTAHEVLGFAAGSAELILGGEGGHRLTVHAGDVAVLPVGTGHCRVQASSDFLVVGAYPEDQQWDICRTAPDAAALSRMHSLPFPATDPATGSGLAAHWRA